MMSISMRRVPSSLGARSALSTRYLVAAPSFTITSPHCHSYSSSSSSAEDKDPSSKVVSASKPNSVRSGHQKYDPFDMVRDIFSSFDRSMHPTFAPGFRRNVLDELFPERTTRFADMVDWSPSVDVRQTEDKILFHADLPGMKSDDVKVNLEDNTLTISGEKKSIHREGDENSKVYREERSFGSFRRAFELPDQVDQEKVAAKFTDGVLEIEVPLLKEKKQRGVEVKIQ